MKKYKVAVVGCGGMCPAWIPYTLTRQDTEITALVDTDTERAQEIKDRYRLTCDIYTDMQDAIERSGANIIYNITPPEVHKEITIGALKAGCHVFSEKPLADNLENSREMVRAQEETGRFLFVMQNRRYLKYTQAYRKLIADGTIGKVGMVTNEFYMNPGEGTFRDKVLEHALLSDMAIHQFDMMRYMFDCDPISVYCEDFTIPGSWFAGKPAAVAIFQMTNDIKYIYIGNWASRVKMTTWEGSWRAVGEKGVASWDENNVISAAVHRAETIGDEKRHSAYDGYANFDTVLPSDGWNGLIGHDGCIESMFEALDKGIPCMTECHDNAKSIGMVYAAIRSAKEGRRVDVEF